MNVQAVEELLSLEFYRFKRYRVPISLALIITDYHDFFAIAIIYGHTDAEGAGFAIDNILDEIKEGREKIRVAVGDANYHDASEHELVSRVFEQLSKA